MGTVGDIELMVPPFEAVHVLEKKIGRVRSVFVVSRYLVGIRLVDRRNRRALRTAMQEDLMCYYCDCDWWKRR